MALDRNFPNVPRARNAGFWRQIAIYLFLKKKKVLIISGQWISFVDIVASFVAQTLPGFTRVCVYVWAHGHVCLGTFDKIGGGVIKKVLKP